MSNNKIVLKAIFTVEKYYKVPSNINLDADNINYQIHLGKLCIYNKDNEQEIEIEEFWQTGDIGADAEFTDQMTLDEAGFDEEDQGDGFDEVDITSQAKPEPKSEHEYDVVKKIIIDGKKYLRSKKTGNVYDYDVYVEEGEKVLVGKWNEEKQQIEFNNNITGKDKDDEDEEYKTLDDSIPNTNDFQEWVYNTHLKIHTKLKKDQDE
jgi:biotin carboxyl carrier protein